MGILAWVVFGLVVGVIAKLLMPGRDPGGCIITMVIGIAGSLLGGFIGKAIGLYSEEVSGGGLIMSVIGAIILLVIYRYTFAPKVTKI